MNLQFLHETGMGPHWSDHARIRTEVFLREQQVPAAEEWDEKDQTAEHFLALIDGKPVATARLIASIFEGQKAYQIGRVAVLKPFRQQGVASALLQAIINHWRTHTTEQVLFLHAQLSALEFYHKRGFIPCGEEFVDAGIVHRTMYYQAAEAV